MSVVSTTIVMVCMGCKKRVVAERADYDPPDAVECHNWCENCGDGGKCDVNWYYDADGKEIRE